MGSAAYRLKSPARVSCNSSTTLRLPMGCIDVADFQVLEVRLLCYGGKLRPYKCRTIQHRVESYSLRRNK